MNRVVKKVAIYSMVGIMQIGFGASVIEASPLYNNPPVSAYGHNQDRHERDRMERERHERERMERERHERERIENERHRREMQRRRHESEREWRERQERENQRHDNTMNEIKAGIIGIIIGSIISQ